MFGRKPILALVAALALTTPALAAQGKGGDNGTHDSHDDGTGSGTHHTGSGSGHQDGGSAFGPEYGHGGSAFGPEYGHRGSAFGPEYGHRGSAFGPEYGHRGSAFGPEYGRSHNHAFDSYHRVYNAPNRFHGGTYYRPHGWYYHRWNYGEFLPALFFAQTYWLTNYGTYDLPSPPPGCVWVRYGSDALLIDRNTGEVIQASYGVFY